jgi:hypothetical protein
MIGLNGDIAVQWRGTEMSAHDYMRDGDVRVFSAAAVRFKVWILVRRSNVAAKQYIGEPKYTPKRLDCKAKTADRDTEVPGLGTKKTAGLVVDPTLPGFHTAFDTVRKYHSALAIWDKFKYQCYLPAPGDPALTWYPKGKVYSVQLDQNHVHYGCALFSQSSLISAAKYIHSDYDLYAIVHRDDPTSNVRVTEQRLGQNHSRGREFLDLQIWVNRNMGVPMVLHGDQEKYSDDTDDKVDVFWPDGKISEAYGSEAIRKLYEQTFQGRKLYGPGEKPQPFFGRWEQI